MKNQPVAAPGRRHFTLVAAAIAIAAGSCLGAGDAASHGHGHAHAVPTTGAQARPGADFGAGLPEFDIRLEDDGSPGKMIREALARFAAPQRAAAARALLDRIPLLRIDDHGLFGTPAFVASTAQLLTPPDHRRSPQEVVHAFLTDHRSLFEIDPAEILAARIARDYLTRHNGVRHLTFQQQIGGIDLVGCLAKANVTARGELINISSSILPRPDGGFKPEAPVLSGAEAIAAAMANLHIPLTQAPAPAGEPEGAALKQAWLPSPDLRPEEAVITELVYFPLTREIIRPAWAVVIPQHGIGHTYDLVVDAVDGTILTRHNRLVFESTQSITFRAYNQADNPAPLSPGRALPDGFQAPVVERELFVVQPADMTPFSPNGWIDDNITETLGNNVDAHLDINADNQPDLPRPSGGAQRVFDFPLDLALAPSGYQSASVAQLFFRGNVFHDVLYSLGFDEVAGNFQLDNFGRGGVGNDRVQADCQDGSGTNNANFNTSGADGSSARCQMYIFTGPTPDRDGSLESDVVYHEFAHGLSIRLHNGLTGTQPRGMGEGWSDFFGHTLLAQPSDDPHGNYPTGPYITFQLSGLTNNYYFGIRRFPYSTSMSVNPETFADIDTAQQSFPAEVPRNTVIGNSASEVHNVGEVWCNALFECRAGLWATHGFAANRLLQQLVVDGMKMSPANPTFLQARDAIIQADQVNNAGANRNALWAAFARRGMGFSATSPVSSTTSGVVESYDTPEFVSFSYPVAPPSVIAPGASVQLEINVTGINLALLSGTGRLHYSVSGGPYTAVPMMQTATDAYVGTLPALACGSTLNYYVSVGTSVGDRTDPRTAPLATFAAEVLSSVTTSYTDDFESDAGWTVGPTTATTGAWTRVDPNGTTAAPEDDHTPAPGVACFVTGQGAIGAANGAADIDNGFTTLVSPAIDLAGASDAVVSYWRWYSNGTGGGAYADVFTIEVSTDNGATWTTGEIVGPGSAASPDVQPGWRFASWSLSSRGLTPTSQVRVRFIAEDIGAGSIVEAAIDDFAVTLRDCVNPPTCPADFNADGVLDADDLSDFITCFFNTPPCPATDYNSDGHTDADDLSDYITAFFAGCG